MTVSTTATKITTEGNGATTAWPFTFAVQAADEIVVTLTESDGTVTVLPSSAYSVTINPTTGTNPTPVGGTVTYPTSGSPVATGNFLTLQRLADYLQETSLANQGISWQSTIEAALDYNAMLIQQVAFQLGQSFSVPVSDDPPAVLPIASLRANLLAGFDADGNLVPVASIDSSVSVSAAMIPVVGAATLPLARDAMGLGAAAVEDIGAGLEDDGAGALRVINPVVADSGNQAVVASFHLKQRYATGALTYTLPAASTLFNGFGFWVAALTASVTFAIDAMDSFSGMSTGVSLVIPAGTQVWVTTDGASGWFAREDQLIGYDSPLNLQINATVATNALTIALKDRNGNDPSTASPVVAAFRDPTATSGAPVIRALTSALSVVVPNGAEVGTADAVPFRLWVILWDNAGTLVLGVINTVTGGATPTAICAINESAPTTGTAIGTGSDLAATFYSATAVTTKSFRILGYIDFSAGQASKGVWATAPSKVQLFGPGIKKSGEVVQATQTTSLTDANTTSATFAALSSSISAAITPTQTPNLIKVKWSGTVQNSDPAAATYLRAVRGGSTVVGVPTKLLNGAGVMSASTSQEVFDAPGSVSAQAYTFQGKTNAGTVSFPPAGSDTGVVVILEEIQV